MIKYCKGNLINAPEVVIAHGCNMQGVMGKGVAEQIAKRFPKTIQPYQFACASRAITLGHVIWAPRNSDETLWLAHVLTQSGYGTDGKRYASYDAIDKGLRAVAERVRNDFDAEPFAMPLIGAGLGGASWRVIEPMVELISRDYKVPIHVYFKDDDVLDEARTS